MDPRRKAELEDCRAVCAAATALGLREIDFFRLAYRRWFGEQPDEKALEKTFANYMLHNVVPQWVRHLSREVASAQDEGTLDSESFGAGRYRDRLSRHPRGPLYFYMTVAVWLVLFVLLLDTRYHPGTSAPMAFCSAHSGSPFFDRWIAMIKGGLPDWCDRRDGDQATN